MILSCKPQFEPPILSGTKIHSMREDKHNRWKAGRVIQFATGIRTKNYRQFFEAVCTGVQKVVLFQGSVGIMVHIDGRQLDWKETLLLAHNDGFATTEAMMRFFIPKIPQGADRFVAVWGGKIIHWTDKIY